MQTEEFEVVVGGSLPDGSDGTPVKFEITYGQTGDGTGLVHARVAPSSVRSMGFLCAATEGAVTPLHTPADISDTDIDYASAAAQRVLKATGIGQIFLGGFEKLGHVETGGNGISLVAVAAEKLLISHIKEHYKPSTSPSTEH